MDCRLWRWLWCAGVEPGLGRQASDSTDVGVAEPHRAGLLSQPTDWEVRVRRDSDPWELCRAPAKAASDGSGVGGMGSGSAVIAP